MLMPYYRYTKTNAKGRWFGKTLAEVAKELGPGAKCVGDQSHIVKIHDIIEYSVHMHEPPAPDPAYEFLTQNNDYVVINKFSGIPVHPTVNYFHNTITERLRPEFGTLHPCYRLDRLTSGVLILAKTPEAASTFQLRQDRDKVYYARVQGHLQSPKTLEWPILHYNSNRGYESVRAQFDLMKSAETMVEPCYYSPTLHQTLVKCKITTGRTHQIRRHLALAGHPIVNDELYNDGAYVRIYHDSSRENFEYQLSQMVTRKEAKKTQNFCPDCGVAIYSEDLENLWLHCQEYTVGSETFKTTTPEWYEFT